MSTSNKHIDITAHYVREIVSRKEIQITYIISAEMIADCLTKPFTANLFERLKDCVLVEFWTVFKHKHSEHGGHIKIKFEKLAEKGKR